MKIRALAAATAALVILAACGGSESSSTTQRTKNGALINQSIPQPTNPDPCELSSSTLPGMICKPKNDNITNTTDISGVTNVVPQSSLVTTPITMPPPQSSADVPMTVPPTNQIVATTTPSIDTTPIKPAAAGSCAAGGLCKVGDIGPGGGIVFYAEATPQPWGQYMEVSQKTLDPNFDTMWCDTPSFEAYPRADALGNGRNTTEWYARTCKRGMLRMATDLVQGGYDDWHLPTLADAKQMYLVRTKIGLEGQWLYTATPDIPNKMAFAVYMVDGQVKAMNPLAGFAGRAIRTFGPRGPWTCANGGSCVIGDTGPAGGKVFYVADKPQSWGQYLEVSPQTLDPRFDSMWCNVMPKPLTTDGTAADPARLLSETYARNCTKGVLRLATDLVVNGFDDWYLPTLAQVKQLYLNRAKFQIEGQWLYTTDVATTPDGKPAPVAFYFVDGQVKAMNYLAGFAARAVRSFGPSIGNPQPTVPPTSPQTSPPTPITPPVPTTMKPVVLTTNPPLIKPSTATIAVPTTKPTSAAAPVLTTMPKPVSTSTPTQSKAAPSPTTVKPVILTTTTKPLPPTTMKPVQTTRPNSPITKPLPAPTTAAPKKPVTTSIEK